MLAEMQGPVAANIEAAGHVAAGLEQRENV
jgi:hypothetical protein